jgi:hypothetical protein
LTLKWRQYDPLEYLEILIQACSVTAQGTLNFSNNVTRMKNLKKYHFQHVPTMTRIISLFKYEIDILIYICFDIYVLLVHLTIVCQLHMLQKYKYNHVQQFDIFDKYLRIELNINTTLF